MVWSSPCDDVCVCDRCGPPQHPHRTTLRHLPKHPKWRAARSWAQQSGRYRRHWKEQPRLKGTRVLPMVTAWSITPEEMKDNNRKFQILALHQGEKLGLKRSMTFTFISGSCLWKNSSLLDKTTTGPPCIMECCCGHRFFRKGAIN